MGRKAAMTPRQGTKGSPFRRESSTAGPRTARVRAVQAHLPGACSVSAVFSLPFDFLGNVSFSLAYRIVRTQYIIRVTYKIW